MRENILRDKSFNFALRIIELRRLLVNQYREYELSRQILRSGTSIGANVEGSVHAQSTPDFIHKLSIAQKEANETNYWLRLLRESDSLDVDLANELLSECEEIQRILTASIKTLKQKVGMKNS